MDSIWAVVATVNIVAAIGFSVAVLGQRHRVPTVTLSWILAFFLLPVLGILWYLFVGFRNVRRRKRRIPKPHHRFAEQHQAVLATLPQPFDRTAEFSRRLSSFPVVEGNLVAVYEEGKETYAAISEAIREAQHHIHLCYYIFQSDETGLYFRDLLIERANAGVTCRLLVDHVGSFSLNESFIRPLRDAGVEFEFFHPLRLHRPWAFHLRNHRKLAVIDGRIGFTGSQNIGDEYYGRRQSKISWRDAHIRVTGPAVAQLQLIFVEDWEFTTDTQLSADECFPALSPAGTTAVQALPSGPDDTASALEYTLIDLCHAARSSIQIITPYFIPTLELAFALEAAARKGIRVELLIPERSDNRLVDLASRTWLRQVCSAGASVYQYGESFVHAKVVLIDGFACLLGSANMDERSFRLNFECSVLLYDEGVCAQLGASFEMMKSRGSGCNPTTFEGTSAFARAFDGVLRVFSPLL